MLVLYTHLFLLALLYQWILTINLLVMTCLSMLLCIFIIFTKVSPIYWIWFLHLVGAALSLIPLSIVLFCCDLYLRPRSINYSHQHTAVVSQRLVNFCHSRLLEMESWWFTFKSQFRPLSKFIIGQIRQILVEIRHFIKRLHL